MTQTGLTIVPGEDYIDLHVLESAALAFSKKHHIFTHSLGEDLKR